MSRYAVGDLQGCLDPLQCLLEEVKFDPAADQLWVVGDMINRGPQSLETVRFLRSLGDSVRIVLGNHDLHFLAIYHGLKKLKKGDSIEDILDAPDCDAIYDWIRHLPLIYTDPSGDYSMIHAGLAPQWTLEQAHALAGEVQQALRGETASDFLKTMYGDEPANWSDDLQGWERLRVITNYFTRARLCKADGSLNLGHKKGPETAPAGEMPWYAVPGRRSAGDKIVFGHWAALLGNAHAANVYALDTGCVWGREMTLLALETEQRYHCDCAAMRTG